MIAVDREATKRGSWQDDDAVRRVHFAYCWNLFTIAAFLKKPHSFCVDELDGRCASLEVIRSHSHLVGTKEASLIQSFGINHTHQEECSHISSPREILLPFSQFHQSYHQHMRGLRCLTLLLVLPEALHMLVNTVSTPQHL